MELPRASASPSPQLGDEGKGIALGKKQQKSALAFFRQGHHRTRAVPQIGACNWSEGRDSAGGADSFAEAQGQSCPGRRTGRRQDRDRGGAGAANCLQRVPGISARCKDRGDRSRYEAGGFVMGSFRGSSASRVVAAREPDHPTPYNGIAPRKCVTKSSTW